MIEKYNETQQVAVKILTNQLKENKTLQAYIFCHNNISFLRQFAKDFCKNLIENEKTSKYREIIYKKIDEEFYDELKIIRPEKGVIKKEQIASIKKFISTKPIEGSKKVYIIENPEKLNITSANSMLKFVEEPEENVVAIFLTQNLDLVLPTIKSRCQIISLTDLKEKEEFEFLNIEIEDEEKLEELILKTIEFIKILENEKINSYYKINKNFISFFSEREKFKLFLNLLLYVYYESFNYKILGILKWIRNETLKDIVVKISEEKVEKIIKKIEKLEKINIDFNFNLNYKLLMDRIIIELCEV